MKNQTAFRFVPHGQKGAALIVSLLMLMIISIIGVVAMRTSIFNAKISATTQGSVMSFQAAESALAILLDQGMTATEAAIARRSINDPTPVAGCVAASELNKAGDCTKADYLDQRGLVKSSWKLVAGPTRGLDLTGEDMGGFQISVTGGDSSLPADCTFVAVGEGQMPVLNIQDYNVQEFARRCFLTQEG
jgi:type IV pilus assembly protein PilX